MAGVASNTCHTLIGLVGSSTGKAVLRFICSKLPLLNFNREFVVPRCRAWENIFMGNLLLMMLWALFFDGPSQAAFMESGRALAAAFIIALLWKKAPGMFFWMGR